MPVAGDAGVVIALFGIGRPSAITGTGKHLVQLGLEHRFDEAAHPVAQASFDRIEPVVKKIARRPSLGMNGFGLRGSACHGVVSCPARQRWMIRG